MLNRILRHENMDNHGNKVYFFDAKPMEDSEVIFSRAWGVQRHAKLFKRLKNGI
jgi:hypothetical protein